MPLFRRKKPVEKGFSSRGVGSTRRAFLKWGIAAAALGGSAFVARKMTRGNKLRYEDFEPRAPSIHTKDNPHGVRGVIERWPEIKDKEMVWIKSAKGEMRPAAAERLESSAIHAFPRKGDRSIIHTHPLKSHANLPPHVASMVNSNPSMMDLLMILKEVRHANYPNPLRTGHVGIMDERGNLMGYVSFRFSKKLFTPEGKKDLAAIEHTLESYYAELGTHWGKDWHKVKDVYVRYLRYLESCKSRGLLMHKTPMPGMEYRNNVFRKK